AVKERFRIPGTSDTHPLVTMSLSVLSATLRELRDEHRLYRKKADELEKRITQIEKTLSSFVPPPQNENTNNKRAHSRKVEKDKEKLYVNTTRQYIPVNRNGKRHSRLPRGDAVRKALFER